MVTKPKVPIIHCPYEHCTGELYVVPVGFGEDTFQFHCTGNDSHLWDEDEVR